MMGFCAITGKNYGKTDFTYLTRIDYYCDTCKFQKVMKERNCFEIRREGSNFYQCKDWEEE